MHADQFLEQLGRELGIADLSFNFENVCRLIVGEDVVIDLEYLEEDQVIQAFSSLGSPPVGEPAWRELLSANLFGGGTGGATLALDAEQNEVILFRSFDLETLEIQKFLRDLNSMTDAAEFWTERLAGIESDESGAAGGDPLAPYDESMLRI